MANTLKKLTILPVFTLLAWVLAMPMAQAANEHGVVIQVSDNDPAKWNLALNNANNLLQGLKDKTQIEIVAYGPGLNMLKKDSKVAARLEEATMHGIALKACQNTMRAQHVTEKDIDSHAGYVPSGAVEIMQRQGEGWAYLRP